MPFKFGYLCDLLQSLDDNRIKKRVTSAEAKGSDARIIVSWFNRHDRYIPRHGAAAVAFLSCLFPERRADRTYNVQEKRLEKIVGRSLLLSTTRLKHLSSWRDPNGADFAQTVQYVMAEAEFPQPRPEHEVTLEEIDASFDRIAAAYSGSSPELRTRVEDPMAADEALTCLFRRLQSVEAKWLIRMFLKRYTPVELPDMLVMRHFHCLLPEILRLQNCFAAALRCLDDPSVSQFCPRPRHHQLEQAIKLEAARHLKPQVGVMVQRATYYKARSIQNCCEMAGRRRISVERKYDGEYCQVHIDPSKGRNCIKIFSKSGKDSTDDRLRLHGVITDALKLGRKDCPIKKACILEGELLIWHEKERQIQPFDKIRKHVTRNGRFLGNDHDSPRDLHERLMIMFYDILLYDDLVCLNESHDQRRSRLHSLIRRSPGKADIGFRAKIDFASSDAKPLIRKAFAECIQMGWEGLVLKGCGEPYFSLLGSVPFIKLKKDYITGLGDMADLAIVGGRRDARDEHTLNIGNLSWTTFHLGCLENHDDVGRFAAKPKFRIIGVVNAAKGTISPDRTRFLNERGQFERIPFVSNGEAMEVIMDQDLEPVTDLFKNPFVVEVVGGGFVKPANATYHTLRFPRITKIHEDRSCSDVMSFDAFQALAQEVQSMGEDADSQGDSEWIKKLVETDPRSKFIEDDSANTSPGHKLGSTTASPTSSAHLPIVPSLVRIDTQELTEQERDERAVLNEGLDSSPSVAVTKIDSPNRKRKSHKHYSNAARPIKRFKISNQRIAGDDNSIESHGERSSPQSCRSPRRKPLVSILNRSSAPKMPCPRTERPQQVAMGLDPAKANPAKANPDPSLCHAGKHPAVVIAQLCYASTSAPFHETEGKPSKDRPLPIPPSSSEEVEKDFPLTTAPAQQSINSAHQEAAIMPSSHPSPRASEQPPPPSSSTRPSCSPLVFLSALPSTTPPSSQPSWSSTLTKLQASFTFSRSHLLDAIQKAPSMSHIALFNLTHSEDAGEQIASFHQSIARDLAPSRFPTTTGEGRLVFFDWDALRVVKERGDGEMDWGDEGLEEHFGGCLVWKWGRDESGRMRVEVRDLWRWREVKEWLR